ncbi:hypothetical protein RchiOBHm_Chr1g0375381 [Rosa chinensis]|uniref:Uncharacterized protein n=1 Tax=Rosa chinensis TaxID=74649 RepID=A0A2P6SMM2_ROSCH|nr:uncharacterized protein LOC112171681 [Rosa chinensis]PRQ59910.1 hypothetical protein RchiOBHm_Chr1g0375381 [Rosa chinensis]
MANYRRAKLAVDAFRGFTPRMVTRPEPVSGVFSTKSSSLASEPAKISGFSPSHSILHKPIPHTQLRYYHVDRRHFDPRRWADRFKRYLIYPGILFLLLLLWRVVGFFTTNYETLPYTKRRLFIILSTDLERKLGESQFEEMKASQFEGKILLAIHPERVRIRVIAKDIIDALKRGLSHDQDMGNAL